jgi:hypothetical protein
MAKTPPRRSYRLFSAVAASDPPPLFSGMIIAPFRCDRRATSSCQPWSSVSAGRQFSYVSGEEEDHASEPRGTNGLGA